MELRQLEYFIAVAEEAGFTRAAERVHISQSGVSAQIRQLEHELGAVLIDRSGRTASLTPAGEAALEPARAALACVAAVRSAVDDVNGLMRGRLVVGMGTACTVTPLFDALAAFHREHPGIEITLIEDTSDQLIAAVRGGAADLALVGTSEAPPSGLEAFPIISERLVAAVPTGHPLLDRRPEQAHHSMTLADVAAHPIVSLPPGTGIRSAFDQACTAAGVRPGIALQATAPDAVADLAIRGLGVAVLTASMIDDHRGLLHPVSIDDAEVPAVLSVVWRTTPNPAPRALLAHARRAFATR